MPTCSSLLIFHNDWFKLIFNYLTFIQQFSFKAPTKKYTININNNTTQQNTHVKRQDSTMSMYLELHRASQQGSVYVIVKDVNDASLMVFWRMTSVKWRNKILSFNRWLADKNYPVMEPLVMEGDPVYALIEMTVMSMAGMDRHMNVPVLLK